MNQEKYTERMRGFLQSAQMLALRDGHQRFVPDHLLKVLLDDPEGLAANLITSAGGDSRVVHREVEANLAKQPKVEGQGAGQIYMAPETARLFEQAEALSEKAGDSFVKVEAPGFAYPCWHDVDKDGKKDLVVGQFAGGKIKVYKSTGGGKFAAGEWLQAGGAVAEVPGVW